MDKRFIAHALAYNATLKVLIGRIDAYHKELDESLKSKKIKARDWDAYNDLKREHQLSKNETIDIAHAYKNRTGNNYLDGAPVNETAARAWCASQTYLRERKHKPGFKKPVNLNTVNGAGNLQRVRENVKRREETHKMQIKFNQEYSKLAERLKDLRPDLSVNSYLNKIFISKKTSLEVLEEFADD